MSITNEQSDIIRECPKIQRIPLQEVERLKLLAKNIKPEHGYCSYSNPNPDFLNFLQKVMRLEDMKKNTTNEKSLNFIQKQINEAESDIVKSINIKKPRLCTETTLRFIMLYKEKVLLEHVIEDVKDIGEKSYYKSLLSIVKNDIINVKKGPQCTELRTLKCLKLELKRLKIDKLTRSERKHINDMYENVSKILAEMCQ